MQQALRARVCLADDVPPPRVIAGVDVSYDLTSNLTRAFVVLVDAVTRKPLGSVMAAVPTAFPYVPGFLSFREIPAILAALPKLSRDYDLLMVDGQGVAHPRRLGIAAHLGVLLDRPVIGVAKSRLVGRHVALGAAVGSAVPLLADRRDGGERIGTVLRSKAGCNPLYVSAGHRMSQDAAAARVAACLRGYRLPEPTRLADKLSKAKTGGSLI